jgi:hypothetical protein
MERTILLDGDILTYQIGFSVESPMYVVDGGVYKRKGFAERVAKEKGLDPKTAIHKRKNIGSVDQMRLNLRMKMKTIFEDLGTRKYRMFITASKVEQNFRNKIATILPYKANRALVEKPFYYKKIREILVNEWKAELIEGQEADDKIGIEQYKLREEMGSFEHSYIASIDKDLRILEGYHYHLNNRNVQYIDADTGLKNFYGQLLKGDGTDNIPGLAKILKIHGREKEANSLIYGRYHKKYLEYCVDHNPEECYNYVVNRYKDFNYGYKEIDEIGNLLWIRRKDNEMWSDNNNKKKSE